MKILGNDAAYTLRALRKSPGFTLAALAILTLGIGANTAVFSIVNAVLLSPFPFPQPDGVVTVFQVPPAQSFPGIRRFAVSSANYIDWRKQSTVFESMAIIGGRNLQISGAERPQTLQAVTTEPAFFDVLRVKPVFGRAFTTEECAPGRDDVIVLSHGFAANHFGSSASAVGRSLLLNGRNYRVIGVMPPDFQVRSWFPAAADGWIPYPWTPTEAAVRANHNRGVVARLRSGASVESAQTEMNVISERLAKAWPEENTGWGAVVITLRDLLVGDVRRALLTLLCAVGFVLLIACANTANLVLVRTITRRKELAIRAALGANARQVVRPVLLESILLSLAGGTLGLLFANSGVSLVMKALAAQMPRAVEVQVDGRVLAFTLIASVVTGLAAGLVASWRLTRADLNESLKMGLGKTDSFSGGARTRNVLVAAEVALSLMLLVGAGLMIRSLWMLNKVDPGFVATNVMTMGIPIPESGDGSARRGRLYDEFLPRVRRLPGVVSVGAIDTIPLGQGGSQQPIVVEGRPAEVFALQPVVGVRATTPDYLRTMGIPLIAGRGFEEPDTMGGKAVVIISQAMARQFWPGENPVGKRLRISFTPEISREVVGVVGDVKERGLNVLDPLSILYEPVLQNRTGGMTLVVRANNASSLVPAVTGVLQQMNPELTVRNPMSMDERIAQSLSQPRFTMYLFVVLASLAFSLAVVGIYSVLTYTVRSRVQEISIRMALGARIGDVLRLVVSEGMKPTLIGIVAGTAGAWMLAGMLSRLVFGVSPADPYTFAAVAALLALVALLACLIPALRATQIQPVSALRNE